MVKGVVNGGAVAYVEGVRGFIPASKLAFELRRRHQRISEQTHPGSGNRCQ